jgi:hypothetical protein
MGLINLSTLLVVLFAVGASKKVLKSSFRLSILATCSVTAYLDGKYKYFD